MPSETGGLPPARRWPLLRIVVLLFFAVALAGCRESGSGGGQTGNLSLKVVWERSVSAKGTVADPCEDLPKEEPVGEDKLPAAVKTIQLVFESNRLQCCVALDRSAVEPPDFDPETGARHVVLTQLPAGEGTVTVRGFAAAEAPAPDGIETVCQTNPLDRGRACVPGFMATPSYGSDPTGVDVVFGVSTPIRVDVFAVPFFVQSAFSATVNGQRPQEGQSEQSPLSVVYTIAMAAGVVDPRTIETTLSSAGGSTETLSGTFTRCSDFPEDALPPCSLNGELEVRGYAVMNAKKLLRPGPGQVEVSAQNCGETRSFREEIMFEVVAPTVFITRSEQDGVSVIDAMSNVVVAEIANVGDGPSAIAFSPDATKLYVTSSREDMVSILDPTAGSTSTIRKISSCCGPRGIAAATTAQGPTVYVANELNNQITVVDASRDEVRATIGLDGCSGGCRPDQVAITRDGTRAYVTNAGADRVTVIDTRRDVVRGQIALSCPATGCGPRGITVSPDGRFVFVTNSLAGTVSVIDNGSEPFDFDRVPTIETLVIGGGTEPIDVAMRPDGVFAYVVNRGVGSISVIRVGASGTDAEPVDTTLPSCDGTCSPRSIAVSPDGGRVYVTRGDGFVSVLDITEIPFRSAESIDVRGVPLGIAAGVVPVPVRLFGGTAKASPGGRTTLRVALDADDTVVSAVQNDIWFRPPLSIAAGENGPNCSGENATFAFLPSGCLRESNCTGMRAVVSSFDDDEPLPPGADLYSCEVEVAQDAQEQDYTLPCLATRYSPPAPAPVPAPVAACVAGQVWVGP